jgi:hypothetical protein
MCGCAGSRPFDIVLPTGETYQIVGAHSTTGIFVSKPRLVVTFRAKVDLDDRTAIRAETLQIERATVILAEQDGFERLTVSAAGPAGLFGIAPSQSILFAKRNGVWAEEPPGGPARLAGPVRSFAWLLGTWNCSTTAIDQVDGKLKRYTALKIYQADAAGTGIVDSAYFQFPLGRQSVFSDTTYDPVRRVWLVRNRAHGFLENDESPQPYARSMTYFSAAANIHGRLTIGRSTSTVNLAGDRVESATEMLDENAWHHVNQGTCAKERLRNDRPRIRRDEQRRSA